MFTTVLRGYRRFARAVPFVADPLNRSVGAVCTAGLSRLEKERLTRLCYQSSHHLSSEDLQDLFPWEQTWFADVLPPAPVSILLPAAGAGREVVALRDLGYEVFGFDPAITTTPNRHGVVRGGFADLLGHRGGVLRLSGAFDRPADAVIFGWGSLSHVYSSEARFKLLAAAAECCPRGPILLSYWSEGDTHQSNIWYRGLRSLGDRVAGWRGLTERQPLPCDFTPNAGLATCLSEIEVRELGRRLNRRVDVRAGAYAHATLSPGRG